MNETERKKLQAEWFASRPACVQRLAAEFPAGLCLKIEGTPPLYVIGWNEADIVIVSAIDPAQDHEGALASKEYLHARCLRANAMSYECTECGRTVTVDWWRPTSGPGYWQEIWNGQREGARRMTIDSIRLTVIELNGVDAGELYMIKLPFDPPLARSELGADMSFHINIEVNNKWLGSFAVPDDVLARNRELDQCP